MDINAEVFEAVGKTAGIGGIAVVVFLFVLMKLISSGLIRVMRPMQVFRLLRLVVNWVGAVAVAGIVAWLVSVYANNAKPDGTNDPSARIKAFSEDERLKQVERLHYTGRDSEKIYSLLDELVKDENPFAEAYLSDRLFNDAGVRKDTARAVGLAQKSFPALQKWCDESQVVAACFYLGEMYDTGVFVGADQKKAFQFIKFSADRGYQRAYNFLGSMYLDGEGVEGNKEIARIWLRKAAGLGNSFALYLLAQSYQSEDDGKYLDYLTQSAGRRRPEAQTELSIVYRAGSLVPRDNEKARHLLEDSLVDTNPESFGLLGTYYELGAEGYPKDLAKARSLYKNGAEYGSPNAMNSYGLTLLYGRGGNKDESEALKWFEKSAKAGSASAKSSLGMLYEQGVAVAKNISTAIEYYVEAAKDNDVYAIERLFNIYRYGLGVPVDKVEARKWVDLGVATQDAHLTFVAGYFIFEDSSAAKGIEMLEKAVSLGSAEAANVLGTIYEEGTAVSPDMAAASRYYVKAKELDPSDPTYDVDVQYSNFLLLESMPEKDAAVAAVLKFAEKDDKWAQYRMHKIYRSPRYQDPNKAMHWLELSAKNGQPCASVDYGLALLKGDQVNKDVPGALHWLEEGFAGGRPNAGFNLGVIYVTGELTAQDTPRGLKYLNDAADLGSNESRVYLARIYRDGKYVTKDLVKSQNYLVKAAVEGDAEARQILEGAVEPPLRSCTASIN
ncbi:MULTISPECIES: tetratricopeptide repeat protein [unclassified Pseudomonas]|uniref:tetratricopeptide repeat protein n=1 Tax=unclassified Pseudomonas TaxID=196821 RepID=UPI000A1F5A3E|nr:MULTISPECIES: tetratricopeptide repeat protein [unclassified Pseudomonas]